MTRRVLLVCGALIALCATACGSSSKQPVSLAPVSYLGRKQVEVDARNNQFSPPDIIVSPGTTVTWINQDQVAHDLKKASDTLDFHGSFGIDAAHFGPGARYSFTFDTAGRYPYVCTIHAAMTGTVTVQSG